jgi:hypothetical protein
MAKHRRAACGRSLASTPEPGGLRGRRAPMKGNKSGRDARGPRIKSRRPGLAPGPSSFTAIVAPIFHAG